MQAVCNICKYEGNFKLFRKQDELHPHDVWMCPNCKSKEQHRLMWDYFTKFGSSFNHKVVLHCSLMKCLADKWRYSDMYISIDLPPRECPSGVERAMLRQDLESLCFKDNYFDFIICSHILDQVEYDTNALKEIWRVLKSGGNLFLVNGIYGEETKTLKKRMGKKKRLIGNDYIETVKEAGFSVEEYVNDDKLFKGEKLLFCKKYVKNNRTKQIKV